MSRFYGTSFLISSAIMVIVALIASQPSSAESPIIVPTDYPTIQSAIAGAEPGATIRVLPGEYAGAFINKSVRIVGSGRETRITSGNPVYPKYCFLLPGRMYGDAIDGTEISNLSIECEGWNSWGVYAGEVDNVTLNRLRIVNAYHPIDNDGGSGWTITNNTIVGLYSASGSFYDHCDAILVRTSGNGPVTGNLIAFNEIWHQGDAVDQELYGGIVLASFSEEMEYNTVIHNRVSLLVPDARYSACAVLLDDSADDGGPVFLRNNIVKFNLFQECDLSLDLVPEDLASMNDIDFNVRYGKE